MHKVFDIMYGIEVNVVTSLVYVLDKQERCLMHQSHSLDGGGGGGQTKSLEDTRHFIYKHKSQSFDFQHIQKQTQLKL